MVAVLQVQRREPMSARRSLLVAAGAGLTALCARLPAADCNRSGREDYQEIREGSSADCNQNAIPDECDIRAVNLGFSFTAGSDLISAADVQAADLDGDGAVDIAAANMRGTALQVLWNDGQGGFI